MNESRIRFPISVRDLEDWVPHREPMLWIDEVSWVKDSEGECRVFLRPDGLYMDQDRNGGPARIRPSSIIEWIAQTYAFVSVVNKLQSSDVPLAKSKKAFLVGVSHAEFDFARNEEVLGKLESLRIHIHQERNLGPFSFVKGSILAPGGIVLASAKIKLYSE